MQQAPVAMHLPLQSCLPARQSYLQVRLAASQAAFLPAIAGQSSDAQQAPQRPLHSLGVPLPGSQPASGAVIAGGASGEAGASAAPPALPPIAASPMTPPAE